ncbi:hypothetical protein BDN72DRAFT_897066 [Pluteus cervinus]|uniref:Uncharacterized protein n=1 Tax=Pluteus cervinus TaxID=181527 RepID=A0ACD3AWF2_9AGAR|nr:hypothetical protein BDN72DRAFT_897066 [Pluteus cervinus]
MEFNRSHYDIAKIDEEIRALEERLVNLRSTRNALIPISRLPPEVLHEVFNIARGQGTHTIHISWVSRAWRDLALESKTLWTLITNSNLRWTSIYLERSFPAPLVVNFEDSFHNENLFSVVIGQLHRMKTLILPAEGWVFDITPIIQDAFDQHGPSPLPHVNLLRLTQVTLADDVLVSLLNASHLSLIWCDHNWTARPPHFPHLRSLRLSEPGTDVSVQDLLDHLQSMPALQLLILNNLLESISDRDSLMARRLFPDGPKLTTLNMVGDRFETILLFIQKAGCITRETYVSLRPYLGDESLDQIKEALVALNRCATDLGHTRGVTHLGLNSTRDRDDIHVEFGTTGGLKGFVNLQVNVEPHLGHGLAILPVLSQSLPLRNLRVLWVKIHNLENIPSWQPMVDVFGHLPQLQHFLVRLRHMSDASRLLVAMTVEKTQVLDQEAPFRSLKTLVFPHSFPSMETFLTFLRSRKSYGLRLETLGLDSSAPIDALRKLMGPDSDVSGFVGSVVNVDKEGCPDQKDHDFLDRVEENQEVPLDIFWKSSIVASLFVFVLLSSKPELLGPERNGPQDQNSLNPQWSRCVPRLALTAEATRTATNNRPFSFLSPETSTSHLNS